MVKQILALISVSTLLFFDIYAQPTASSLTYFPDSVLFSPLVANHEEPRVSFRQHIGSSLLEIGIGSMADVLEYRDGGNSFRFGIEVFAYALSRDIEQLKFEIDVADGFFGVHFTYTNESPLSFRLRLLHLSAHLVDGHFKQTSQRANDIIAPEFSRNSGEFIGTYQLQLSSNVTLRVYTGLSYAVRMIPSEIRRFASIHGFELRIPTLSGKVSAYAAHNLTLRGVPRYVASNNVEVGLKFGRWNSGGLRLCLSFYTGLDKFGQYYDMHRKYVALGFAIDIQ